MDEAQHRIIKDRKSKGGFFSMPQKSYDRPAALAYARKWALGRNPAFLDFENLGGDCTNFISQCVYAGSGVMNFTPTFGWYYRSPSSRAPAWTGVDFFYNFMTGNKGPGPVMEEVPIFRLLPGDVIQLGTQEGQFYHSLLVIRTGPIPTRDSILIATHTYDAYLRPLNTYDAPRMRFLHVKHVNLP